MRIILLTLIASAISFYALSQNLVPNPGFENYRKCPGNHSQAAHEFTATDWAPATRGTPDHFHACSNGEANVPHNWAGVSDAYEGKGYAGIFLWMKDTNDYREYLQCRLIQPLIQDSLYRISFRYKLSSYSKYSIDRIGLLLSNENLNEHHDNVLAITPTLSVVHDSALTRNTGLWEIASLEYKAKGNEQYLTIGNFYNNEDTHYYKTKFRPLQQIMLAESAYYYVDDVRVIDNHSEKQLEPALLPEFTLAQTELNKTYVLKNIQFELNSYKLVPPSFEELAQVAAYLIKNPKTRVQFFGHTDDQGSDVYNLKLSENRAKSAAGFLSTLGIRSDRMEVFSYGETKPLIKEVSEVARIVNRRVEIRFIK